MTIKEAKNLDMVSVLAGLGHHPTRISEPHYWYHSPLREERSPSFKINRRMNRWKDWGSGDSGNLVDFGILYYRCNVREVLSKLETASRIMVSPGRQMLVQNRKLEENSRIQILAVKSITSLSLMKYLRERRIPEAIAQPYLKEVIYELRGRNYYALGFKNDAGGYELRNPYIKAASSPKDSTFINNQSKDIAVFEGFFDFLSYCALCHQQQEPARNFLILNSTSFFDKNIRRMQDHRVVHLFLDNDKTGQKFTQQAIDLEPDKFRDERSLYKNYNDLNEWVSQIGLSQRQRFHQK